MNQVVALYTAMERVRRGGDPLEETRRFLEQFEGRKVTKTTVHRRRVEIIHLWRAGMTVKEIVSRTGASDESVYRTLRELRGEVARAVDSGGFYPSPGKA